jgi:hypothetical protein
LFDESGARKYGPLTTEIQIGNASVAQIVATEIMNWAAIRSA